MQPRWISLLAVSLCLVLLPVAPAKSATIRLPYEGPAVLSFSGLAECEEGATRGTGVVCLYLPPTADDVTFRAEDVSGLAIGGTYYLYDDADAFAGQGTFCGAKTLALDRAVVTVVVRLEVANGPFACLDAGNERTSLPTRGVVAFELR